MNKKTLEKLIEKRKKKMQQLVKRSNESNDVEEVRRIGDDILEIRDEINELETELESLSDEADPTGDEAERAAALEAQRRSAGPTSGTPQPEMRMNPVASYAQTRGQETRENTDPFDTVEYRTAFMDYVCRGVQIPHTMQTREAGTITTSDTSAVIPTTLMREIIKELDTYGNIYSRVRKLNVQGGVEFPLLTLKPEASHTSESSQTTEAQKVKINEKITFAYHGYECKIAQTLLSNVTTLEMFNQMFVPLAVEAVIKLIEHDIFAGTGSGQLKGILKDSRVPTKNIITLSQEDFTSYTGWKKKVFAKMKKAYRNGVFLMAQGTWDGYIDGMVDANGQPIGRINYGINNEENYRFCGKAVETVEDEIIANYEDASSGDVVAVFVNLNDYAINSNLEMTVVKWTDNDTSEVKNKVMLIADGKLLDPNGVIIIKKGASAGA